MSRRLSIRWRLILSTFALVLAIACGLIAILHARTHDHLLGQLGKTLERRCDEVRSVLRAEGSPLTFDTLFTIETNYRFPPYTYFYQIADRSGRVLARSHNLRDNSLPVPPSLIAAGGPAGVLVEDVPYPAHGRHGEVVRLRSERIPSVTAPWGRGPLVLQVAVSLRPLQAAMHRGLVHAVLYAAGSLALVLVLLWSVITRALRPVAHMTKRASTITAANLRERLPRSGTGDELDQLAGVLNEMLDRLRQSWQQMEQFTSDAAHQIRTPLTRILLELDVALRNGIPAGLREHLEGIQGEVERLTHTCGRLLLLARLDHDARDRQLFGDRVRLDEVACELVEQMTPLARERAVALTLGRLARAEVCGSRQLIVEAVLNLLHNAIRFAGEGGRVEVSLGASSGGVTLAVQDSGPGIPRDEQEHIFRRFYRVQRPAGDAGEGTGLGLAIVQAIARAHGGTVEVVSSAGSGSCFRLTVPVGANGNARRSVAFG